MRTAVENQIGKTLFKDMKWTGLRELQEKSFEEITNGKNVLITAGTASGKTEASLLPILSIIMNNKRLCNSNTPVALYIAPLKALINDICGRLKKLTYRTPLKVFAWHGDIDDSEKSEALLSSSILVTTPESLEGMFISNRINKKEFFSNLNFVLIDELHALIASPRGAQLSSLLERAAAVSGNDIQRIGMSATIGNPVDVLEWLRGSSSRDTVHISDDKTAMKMLMIREKTSENLTKDLIKISEGSGKAILFTSSKSDAESIFHFLDSEGFKCLLHHGSLGKNVREKTEKLFKENPDYRIMIATTTLEMGIDIGDVTYVLFYSSPQSAASFMQRFGRAGRKTGIARAVIYAHTENENPDKLIEEHLTIFGNLKMFEKGEVEPILLPSFYPQILAHQIISMVISSEILEISELAVLKKAHPFSDISFQDVDIILEHLILQGFLAKKGSQLRLGHQGNLLFSGLGKGTFASVFQTGQEYSVFWDSKEVGKIHRATCSTTRKMAEAGLPESFYLAGRAWKVIEYDDRNKILKVVPDGEGIKPIWLGGGSERAKEFSLSVKEFLKEPKINPNIKMDPAVSESFLKTIDSESLTSEGEGFLLIPVKRKKSIDYKLYTYRGKIYNSILGLLLSSFNQSTRNPKANWRHLKFKSSAELSADELFDWVNSISPEEFIEIMEEKLVNQFDVLYSKLFSDSCGPYISEELKRKALILVLWSEFKR